MAFVDWLTKACGSRIVLFDGGLGTALQALDYDSQPVSLLPADYQLAWRKHLTRQRIELASIALIFVCAVLLGIGTWHKLSLIHTGTDLQAKIQAGQEAVDADQALTT